MNSVQVAFLFCDWLECSISGSVSRGPHPSYSYIHSGCFLYLPPYNGNLIGFDTPQGLLASSCKRFHRTRYREKKRYSERESILKSG